MIGLSKERATLISERGLYLCRQLPTLPHSCSAGAPARERAMAKDSSRTFRRLKSLHLGVSRSLIDSIFWSRLAKVKFKVKGSGRGRPALHDSSMTFRRVKSSHFGCVQVTDRFDLFGHTHESQIQSQRQRAGAPAPHIHDSQHMTQASLKGKYEYRRRLPHYQKDDRAR